MASRKLQELREKLYVKQDALARIFDQAKQPNGTYDFLQADAYQHMENQAACLEMNKQLETEAEDIHNEVMTLEGLEAQEEKLTKAIQSRKALEQTMIHASGNGHGSNGGVPVIKSLGQLVMEAWPTDSDLARRPVKLDKDFKHFEVKTLMTTTAGWGPEATRIPRIAEFAHRPIQITDLFPVGNTDQFQVVYMEETTSTNAAVEKAEAAAFAEATFVFTERTVTIRKIPVYITVTDEQLADVQQVASLIDTRLRFFVQQRLDLQLMLGDGIAPNILGLVSTPNVQTQAKGADSIPDAIYKAMVKVRVTGRATPSAVVIHPNDWQDVRLLSTTGGQYIWGHPSEVGPIRIWGVPVVESDVITENTAIVGDFANQSQLWMRQGVEVLAGYVGDNFIEGKQVIRATLRAALTVYRPSGYCLITGV